MITTMARDFRTVDVSANEQNTVLCILSNEELEKERHNTAYFAELKRRIKNNKLVEHEIVETDHKT